MDADAHLDRLYNLLPTIYRTRDAEQGEPLRQLLRVIAEQVNVVEDDIAGLYENWFIETCQDWAVPYLGDVVGHTPVHEAGDPSLARPDLDRILFPRREVANTLRARRRKGTLALLEELGRDVAGWPTRAVEFFPLLVQAQHLAYPRPQRGRSVDLRRENALELLGGPFDQLAHGVDLRRTGSALAQGRYNLPSVGLFVWRLRAYPVTEAPATCIEEVGPFAFTFSVLGHDAPLFAKPEPEPGPDHIAGERDLPVAIRRRALERHPERYYGEGQSFVIYRGTKRGSVIERSVVPPASLVAADLSGWQYQPRRGTVAVDPVLGRIAFHPREAPAALWVSYHYGFSADIGGGEYRRPVRSRPDEGTFYREINKRQEGATRSLERALRDWQDSGPKPPHAILEFSDSEVYSEQLSVTLRPGERLEIRAANGTRPVIYLLDRERNQPDAFTVVGAANEGQDAPCLGRLTLDGLLITGRALHIEGALSAVCLRHCTLVPGWGLHHDCEPERPAEPSLELYQTNAQVCIEKSILGSIQVEHEEVTADPTEIQLSDSVLDATGSGREAIGAPNWPKAHATLSFARCTVVGQVQTHAIRLAENTIFTGPVRVARSQLGCLRFCFVPPGSRTPRRYHCQPDLVDAPTKARADWNSLPPATRAALLAPERLRVRPQLDGLRYGLPTYARLRLTCAPELTRGAEDESEMGVFHDLFQPQRQINLAVRLEEYTPARADVGLIFAD